jgi:hypothetical protein
LFSNNLLFKSLQSNHNNQLLGKESKVKEENTKTERTETDLTEEKVTIEVTTTEDKVAKESDVNTDLNMNKKEASKSKRKVEAQILKKKLVISEESKSKSLKMMASFL